MGRFSALPAAVRALPAARSAREVSFLASLTAAYSVFFAAPEAMCRNFLMVFLLYFVCSYQVMMGARFSALTALAPVVAMS